MFLACLCLYKGENMTKEEMIKAAGEEAKEYIESLNDDNYKNPSMFWNIKKKILKEKYDIDWLTPEEENPHIEFN